MKKKHNVLRSVFTMLLVFTLVITGMGIGSWDVDNAWADDTEKISIDLDQTGVTSEYYICNGIPHTINTINSNDGEVHFTVNRTYIVRLAEASFEITNNTGTSIPKTGMYLLNCKNDISISRGKKIDAAKLNTAIVSKTALETAGYSNLDSEATAYYYLYFDKMAPVKYAVLVEITPNATAPETFNKEDLCTTINGAPNVQTDTSYYHKDDRYNGKVLSKNGLWKDYQDALNDAKSLFIDNDTGKELQNDVTGKDITKNCGLLKRAINNLIPNTQSNTTALFETIQDCMTADESLYDREKLAIYNTKKQTVSALLASLFDGDGNATKANVVSKQADIDKSAKELSAAYRDLTIDISSQEQLTAFMTEAKDHKLVGSLKDNIFLKSYTPTNTFAGTLDGNGYTVTVDNTYKGLTSKNMGTIKNIKICGDSRVSDKQNSLRSFITDTNSGIIENCNTNIDIGFSYNYVMSVRFGCICGTNTGTISKCYNTGNLRTLTPRCIYEFGGICNINQGKIKDCYNSGNIILDSSGLKAGGIAAENKTGGSVEYCYNTGILKCLEPWVEPTGFDYDVGTWLSANISPIVGCNSGESGSVSNCYYIDTIVKSPKDNKVTVELSETYLTKADKYERYVKNGGYDADTVITPYIGTYVLTKDDTTFSAGKYYVYYDVTNNHFIAVKKSAGATSNVINAASPSTIKTKGRTYRGLQPGNGTDTSYGDGYVEKTFYLVEIPEAATNVVFTNTEEILDPTCGMNNLYGFFYDIASKNLKGTQYIDELNLETIRRAVKTRWPEMYDTISSILEMPLGSKYKYSTENPGEIQTDKIKVTFRLIGATKSKSGKYDVSKDVIDSDYVNWVKTTSYTMEKGDTVGNLFEKACKDEGFEHKGLNKNYISSIKAPASLGGYWLSEFTNGPWSGWMYTVNGKHPNVGLNSCYLNKGDTVIWHYINDYRYECSDWFDDPDYPNLGNKSTWDPWLKVKDAVGESSTNPGTATATTTAEQKASVTAKVEVTATVSDDGKATVKPAAADITKAIEQLAEAAKKDATDKKTIVITVLGDSKAKAVEMTIPKVSVAEINKGADKLIISSSVGEVSFDAAALKTIAANTTADLKISITKEELGKVIAKISGISAEAKKELETKLNDRPVYDFSAESGSKKISQFSGKVKMALAYTPKANEQKEALVAYWVMPNGNLQTVIKSGMASDGKNFNIEANHWSTYAIGYNPVNFADTASHWAKSSIGYLAARDVIKGKTEDSFAPNTQITRAEFVQILANMSGDDLSIYTGSKFKDVSEDAWYAKAVAWAVAKGVGGGTGEDVFSPNANITRQDMSVMIAKYAANVEKETLTAVNKKVSFADAASIASYASDAVTKMQKAGIINGAKNSDSTYSFNPKANATRAEAATMIANYIK